ncbi:unnamed protein product [Cunninghamella blakesleeana]
MNSTIIPSTSYFKIKDYIDPTIHNLSKVSDFLSNTKPKDIDDTVLFLLANNYTEKLISLFDICEQNSDHTAQLRPLNNIIYILLSWSEISIIKEFLKEEHITGFLGILEHDGLKKKILFREQFKSLNRLNLDTNMMNEDIYKKIRQIENLIFIKSQLITAYQSYLPKKYSILVKLMDRLITRNRIAIIHWIQCDGFFIQYILNLLQIEEQNDSSSNDKEDQKSSAVDFLHFIFYSSKLEYQPFTLITFIKLSLDHGLLNTIHLLISNGNYEIRSKVIYILNLIIEYDLETAQNYILDQSDKNKYTKTLLQTLFELWTKEDHIDLAQTIYLNIQCILGLITPSQHQPKVVNKETFFLEDPTLNNIIKHFHSQFQTLFSNLFNWIEIQPINVNGHKVLELENTQVITYGNICELFEKLISNNNFPSKSVLPTNFFSKMIQLFRCPDYTIKLKTLRFFMACVRLKEEEYYKLLVKSSFFSAIIGLLLNDELQQDALYIESQELFNYIHQNNINTLRDHIISQYSITIRPLIASDIIQDPQKPFTSENMIL